jgi:hypothetical protein
MHTVGGTTTQATTRARGRGYRAPTAQDQKRQADRGLGMTILKGLTFAASSPVKLLARGIGEVKDLATGRNDHQGSVGEYMSNRWDNFSFRWEK